MDLSNTSEQLEGPLLELEIGEQTGVQSVTPHDRPQTFNRSRIVGAAVFGIAVITVVAVAVSVGHGNSDGSSASPSRIQADHTSDDLTMEGSLHTTFKAVLSMSEAAVTTIVSEYPGSQGPALLVSTFGVSLVGGLPSYVVPNLPQAVQGKISQAAKIEDSQKWTNYIGMAPASVGQNLVTTAGGFLVPVGGISTGKVCLFNVTDASNVIMTQLSTDKSGWFYHQVAWHDMNGDGRLDLVAARATAPKDPAGELVWFEQPASAAVSTARSAAAPWECHVVADGPDVDFILADLDSDGLVEVVATQFFSEPILAVYSCPQKLWSDCSPANVVKTVIDDVSGPFFSVERVDLNNDGILDLLVTNNQDNKESDGAGSVFAFEQPAGDYTGKWGKRVLATGYVPNPTLMPSPGAHSRGSPGKATAFHAVASSSGKPQVLVSGDDAGFVSVLHPLTEESDSWEYTQDWISNSTGTVGTPSVGDVDGDGLADVFIPFYSENKIEVYSFAQSGPSPAPSTVCSACLLRKDPVKLSPAYDWCYKDNQCYLVGDFMNPCSHAQCASAAQSSSCACTSCNDGACPAAI